MALMTLEVFLWATVGLGALTLLVAAWFASLLERRDNIKDDVE